MSADFNFDGWASTNRARIQALLDAGVSESDAQGQDPGRLRASMRYSLLAPGKRIRPLMGLAAAQAVGAAGDEPEILRAVCAVELVHCYSLIHDDLPAMDDDDMRRGKPSNHRAFNEAVAILAGDALLTEAFGWVADAFARLTPANASAGLQAVIALSKYAGMPGMVGGQARDLGEPNPKTLPDLEVLHLEKTGGLFQAAAEIGALAAGASPEDVTRISEFAWRYGVAFQHADDVDDGEHEGLAKESFARRRTLVTEAAGLVEPFGPGRQPCDTSRNKWVSNPRQKTLRRKLTHIGPKAQGDQTRCHWIVNAMSWDDVTHVHAPPPTAKRPPENREQAFLVVLSGSCMGEMYRISKSKTVIGRGQKADIRILDDGISREHCQIHLEDGVFTLSDLGSTNGTYCKGIRTDSHALADGDKILVGSNTILKFSFHDQEDEKFQRQMYESALRDDLTKAFNKKYFMDRLESEFAYSVRHQSPLSLVGFDIDHFKQINDTYGHPAGDRVLADLSKLMLGLIRVEDVFARVGGEEFSSILRGADSEQGLVVAERLRQATAAQRFEYEGQPIPVTISVGLVSAPNHSVRDAMEFIAAADQALYEAKRGGRNRVCVWNR